MHKRQAELLRIMKDQDEWLVWSGREVWVDLERTNVAMVYRMLRRMWIKHPNSDFQYDDYLTFEITSEGLEALNAYDKLQQRKEE